VQTHLNPLEARVLGSLIEKQITTPDQYPLSLNALVNACNQKSNRDPLMALTEADVQRAVDDLGRKHLVLERLGIGSRVQKYQQVFCNTEFGQLKFTAQELALVCELLLRGPQTPGELRGRASRLASFAAPGDVDAALAALASRQPHAVVARLPREAGRRDSCYAQLFTGPVETAPPEESSESRPVAAAQDGKPDRLTQLEDEVRQLREEFDALRDSLRPSR